MTLLRLFVERPVAHAYGYAVKATLGGSIVLAALVVGVVLGLRGFTASGQKHALPLLAALPIVFALLGPGWMTTVRFNAGPWPLLLLDIAEAVAFVCWGVAVLGFAWAARQADARGADA